MNGRPTVACIDLEALRGNFAAVRARLPAAVSVMAVVKADGYGHAARLVAPVLVSAGADMLGVATVEEGVELREMGIAAPIVVLAGALRAEADVAVACRLSVAVVDAAMARDLAAGLGERPLPVHLKLDTGMSRLGVREEALGGFLDVLKSLPQLRVEGVFSHFADADDASGEYADRQLGRFREQVERVRGMGFQPRWIHLANSVATLGRSDTHGNLVRPGIILYGVVPGGAAAGPWRPVMHLRTRVWQVKEIPADTPVSYGLTFAVRRRSRIAVLPIGYADGYPRALSNRGEVLVRGRRAPVIGRICMDLTMVDVTDLPGVAAGDEVVLWGRQGEAELPVGEVAGWHDTISYELLTRVGKRVPRVPLSADAATPS